MLKKKNRLTEKLSKSDRTINSPAFVLKIARNETTTSRFGFVISKKIDKRATVRNRIKRKFRFCLEEKLEKISKGYDFLFIIKKNLESANYCEEIYNKLMKEKLLE